MVALLYDHNGVPHVEVCKVNLEIGSDGLSPLASVHWSPEAR